MANDVQIVSAAPQVYVRYTWSNNGQSNTGNGYTNITVNCYALIRNGSRTGGWDWNAQVEGSNGGSRSVSGVTGDFWMGSRNILIYHDADGNWYGAVGAWLDVYYGNGTASDNVSMPKITRSASWSSASSSNIKPTTATISNTVADWGIGTSHGHKMYYRIQGSGSAWSSTSDETTTSPKSWNLTGLKPGKVYEYYGAQWNNNTSAVNGTTQTFKTKGLAGPIVLLSGAI
jgi:hypothetical protein